MSKVIDACGLSCPQPILMFLEAVKKADSDEFEVLVDAEASRENVTRAAKNRGFLVEEQEEGNGVVHLHIKKG